MTSVAVIGNSQAQGLVHMGGIAQALADKGYQFAGSVEAPGQPASTILERLEETFAQGVPDVVLVVLGGTDRPTEAAAESWRTLIRRLFARGVRRIVWAGPPPAEGDQELDRTRARLDAMLARIVPEEGAVYVSGRETTLGLRFRDAVHLTAASYRTWARMLVDRIPTVTAGNVGRLAGLVVVLALVAWGGWTLYRMRRR